MIKQLPASHGYWADVDVVQVSDGVLTVLESAEEIWLYTANWLTVNMIDGNEIRLRIGKADQLPYSVASYTSVAVEEPDGPYRIGMKASYSGDEAVEGFLAFKAKRSPSWVHPDLRVDRRL